jgi:hypothetical protein
MRSPHDPSPLLFPGTRYVQATKPGGGSSGTRIRAVVRVRPLLSFEAGHGSSLLSLVPPGPKHRGMVVLQPPGGVGTAHEYRADGAFEAATPAATPAVAVG